MLTEAVVKVRWKSEVTLTALNFFSRTASLESFSWHLVNVRLDEVLYHVSAELNVCFMYIEQSQNEF